MVRFLLAQRMRGIFCFVALGGMYVLLSLVGSWCCDPVKPAFSADRAVRSKLNRRAAAATAAPQFVVLAYNDLGMHCMNPNFAEFCLLPPFNNLHAQVIRRAEEPQLVTKGVTVKYSIPGNTNSVLKTDFWQYAGPLFNVKLPANIGLTGYGLSGSMKATNTNDWAATGIPITPILDDGSVNPFQLANVSVVSNNKTIAFTKTVIPVSSEISCNICHNTPGISVETDILRKHDRLHPINPATGKPMNLEASKPVLCASCHADPALGTKGMNGVKAMSHAMHGAHANRMGPAQLFMKNTCYACHPGVETHCQRDIHFARGIECNACHGGMADVGKTTRTPWVSEPTCGSCHSKRRPDFQFEEPGKLFKESRGHGGVHCAACHGSPHAITPTVTEADNVQAIMHQGHAGTINKCTVCHTVVPDDPFPHKLFGEGIGD